MLLCAGIKCVNVCYVQKGNKTGTAGRRVGARQYDNAMKQFIAPFISAGIAKFACNGPWRKMTPRVADDGYHKANDATIINLMAEMLSVQSSARRLG